MKVFRAAISWALVALCASYAPAPLGKDGSVIDTPEVAHEKAQHYSKLAKAGGALPHDAFSTGHSNVVYSGHDYRYHGPPAPLNHDGTVAETPEVKHVKAERLAALAEGFSKAGHHLWKRSLYGHYQGPPAPLNHDGTVAETEEVKHVKAERLAALYEAFAKAPKGHEESYDHEGYEHKNEVHYEQPEPHHYHEKPEPHHHHEKPQYRYHGPPAPLNHDGTVAETDEVKHIKAERLAALAEGFAKAKKEYYHDRSKRSYDLIKSGHYHGPPAPLNHDGTVAETEEVKHLKAERLAALYEAFAKAPKGHEESYDHESYEHKNEVHYEKPERHQYHVKPEPHHHHEKPQYRYHGPPAPLNHDGTVAETEEVKHIKAERLAALAEGFAKAKKDFYYHDRSKRSYDLIKSGHYHGPPAPLNHDGTVDETPEVKHLKAEHLAALHEAFAKAPKGEEVHYEHPHEYEEVHYEKHEPQYRYHGPPAPLNHDGTVDETPEVKHLKAEHLAALHEAIAKAPKHDGTHYKHHNAIHHEEKHEPKDYRYHGPPAPLNHDGTVAETPEVHARKIEHLEAHYKAKLG